MKSQQKSAPRRYGQNAQGQPERLWNGKTAEQLSEQDTLLFMADTDLCLFGKLSAGTLSAIRQSGYSYENGALSPLEKEEQKVENNVKLDVRAYPIAEPKGNTVGFASVTINDMFAVHGIRVMSGEKGLFAAMPSVKDSKGEYRDVCFPVTADLRKQLNAAVVDAYTAAKEQERPSVKEQMKEASAKAPESAKIAPAAEKTPKSAKKER